MARLALVASAAAILAAPAAGKMAQLCSSTKQTPSGELRCGKRNLWRADHLLRFVREHPGAGDPVIRARLRRDGRWLKRYALRHIATARGRLRPAVPWYVSRQIWAANILGRESAGDPWPNCPDPFDGGGSWQDTVNCENGGSWLDSPGFYRCGLQFAPSWELRFGRLCP